MEIRFCGADREVTGSSHLLILDDGYKILLDCGLYQGSDEDMADFNKKFCFDPGEIDMLILSHAHIDHSGRLPKLVKDGFKGLIHTTHATRSLCAIMLLDSAKIQEYDAEYENKRRKRRGDKRRVEPLYRREDVKPCMDRFVTYGYDKWFTLRDGIEVQFRDAGHILGSASVNLRIKDKEGNTRHIGFTGDIGRPDRPILRDPVPMIPADYVITESTYGDRLHDSRPAESDKLIAVIKNTCVEKQGKLIIPAFSIGRTQEIVYMLDKLAHDGILPRVPVYVDSPLAINATVVFGSHPECYDSELNEYLLVDEDPFGFNSLKYVRKVEGSKALNNSEEPCVIISASGMMTAGRVKHHLYHNIEDAKNTFLIVGYCAPYTPGGRLKNGAETIKVFGDRLHVNADIEVMDSFSSHGDQLEMAAFLSVHLKKIKELFLVHGDYDTQLKFKEYLNSKGFESIHIPKLNDTYEL